MLFRQNFTNEKRIQEAELHIFADTRYEVWVDGGWIGRGPARFSKTLHEYDIYPLGGLQPGDHLIAVLVQWAPNIRRSESTRPYLRAHIQENHSYGVETILSTGPAWRSLPCDAWRADAVQVHAWNLIGPTELLDLRRLPVDWNQPDYQEGGWPQAVVVDTDSLQMEVTHRPRSIPMLVNTPITAALLEAGRISPGVLIGELTPDLPIPYTLTVTATQPTTIHFELLVTAQEGITETGVVEIDGIKPDWRPVDPLRPDVHQASIPLNPGAHAITFSDSPSDGITFGLASPGIMQRILDIQGLPFSQGTHAGRRLLLAQLKPGADSVHIDESNGQFDIEFISPPAYVVLDLGRTVHGRLTAEVEGQPGAIVDIGWDERLTPDTQRPLPFPGSSYPPWNQVDSWILDGNTRTLTTIDARAGRYLLVAAWGKAPIRMRNIQIHEEHYPVIQVGSFHTSDALLNQIWQVGVDTLLPNMLDSYVDTPWRERGQWWGDAYVANRINQVAFGDQQLVQRGLDTMADTMQYEPAPGLSPSNLGHHMLDYTMLWVHSLAEMIQISPDEQAHALATDHYATLTRFMEHLASYENPTSNLLDLPERHWSQNAYIDTFGRHSRIGQPTALNALYYSTLQQAAFVADTVDDPLSAGEWRQKAQQVKQSINVILFVPSEHRYISNLYNGEAAEPSPHAQAWPLVYQIVPDEEIPKVADALLELVSTDPNSPNINVYGMYWVLEALGKSGKIVEGIEVIHDYYGYMLEMGATTWWELFSMYPNRSQSLSHSWGGAPTRFLSTYVLGLSRTGPNTWQLEPAFDSFDSAQGMLPLQDSTLRVQWEKRSCSETIVKTSSEKDSSGRLVIPYEPSLTIRHNQSLIWHDQTSLSDMAILDGSQIHIALSGGRQEITIYKNCALP